MASNEANTFYDLHPFDWAPPDASGEIQAVVSRPLVDLIDRLNPSSLVLDIGCGPGRVLGFLTRRRIRCIGLDFSRVSLALAVKRYNRPGVVADNLRLPLASGIADFVISDGVIHHTEDPQAAFYENCRVLKPGGEMYLAVYKPSGRYPLLYKFPGKLIRRGLRHKWSRPLVTVLALGPYYIVHLMRSRGRRTWAGAQNLFFDYFVTPRVAFLPCQVIEEWCSLAGIRIAQYEQNRGANVHSFHLVKESQLNCRFNSERLSGPKVLVAEKRETA